MTGPTSALAVALAVIVAKYHNVDMVLLLAILIGVVQMSLALARVGSLVRFIPEPVLVGFSTGVACIIFGSQFPKMFDVSIGSPENFIEIVEKVWQKMIIGHAMNFEAAIIGFSVFFLIFGLLAWKKTKNLPIPLIALVFGVGFSLLTGFDIKMLAAIPNSLPAFHLPEVFTLENIKILFPSAIALGFLASVESLATAQIASKMTGVKFDSNKELFGQGLANFFAGFFKGIPSTGSFSRTAANVRSGGATRFAMIIHSLFLLLIVLVFSGYSKHIPSVVLAAILLTVAIRMVEVSHIKMIFRSTGSDIMIFLATLSATLIFDLIKAIEIGVFLAMVFVLRKVSLGEHIHEVTVRDDRIEKIDHTEPRYCPQLQLLQIDAPLFFGVASHFEEALITMRAEEARVVILRMKAVTHIDMSGTMALEEICERLKKQGGVMILSGVTEEVLKVLKKSGVYDCIERGNFTPRTKDAIRLFFAKYADTSICARCPHRVFKECPKI